MSTRRFYTTLSVSLLLIAISQAACPNPLYLCPVVEGCNINGRRVYGDRSVGNVFHAGIDLRCDNSDVEIRAVDDGEIIGEGKDGRINTPAAGYGLWFEIKHEDGRKTKYCHLANKTPGLKKGSHVLKGQVIGHCGTTGWSNGVHLHFEYRDIGARYAIDPWPCINQKVGPGTGAYGKAFLYRVTLPHYGVTPVESIKTIKTVKTKIPQENIQEIQPLPKEYKGKPVSLRGDKCGDKFPQCHPELCRCKGYIFNLINKKCVDLDKHTHCPTELYPVSEGMSTHQEYFELLDDYYYDVEIEQAKEQRALKKLKREKNRLKRMNNVF